MSSAEVHVLGLRRGEILQCPETKGKRRKVTDLDVEVLPRIRDYLIEKAKRRETVTYGQLKRDLGLTHANQGLGHALDVLAVAAKYRLDEPSLAALVVNQDTGRVGTDFVGNPDEEREAAFGHRWP